MLRVARIRREDFSAIQTLVLRLSIHLVPLAKSLHWLRHEPGRTPNKNQTSKRTVSKKCLKHEEETSRKSSFNSSGSHQFQLGADRWCRVCCGPLHGGVFYRPINRAPTLPWQARLMMITGAELSGGRVLAGLRVIRARYRHTGMPWHSACGAPAEVGTALLGFDRCGAWMERLSVCALAAFAFSGSPTVLNYRDDPGHESHGRLLHLFNYSVRSSGLPTGIVRRAGSMLREYPWSLVEPSPTQWIGEIPELQRPLSR
ncbi:hypothetical protein ACCAA_1460006 [Candidatus Accumulibacter aalborgensis]|uniref:Uncharacterized protein n=1 Tax=Candidatus Accumulibacter aalborgensis TaxID=1860102 RepID=A0A1A8XH51_9PROT|nr:hypothetical protein ACCAA_1460006 [Candidatus Accumulibacter aalborgensis]